MTQGLPKFSFAKLAQYTGPYEGSDVLPFVGYAKAVITGGTPKRGEKPPHNPCIQWQLTLQDEDCKGAKLSTTKAYGGVDKRGGDLSRQTADVLASCGVLDVAGIQAQAAAGSEVGPEDIIAWCTGRDCYVEIGAGTSDEGKEFSQVENFILAEKYAEYAKTPGMYRRERPKLTPAARTPAAPVGGVPNLGGVRPSALGPVPPAGPAAAAPAANGPQGGLPFAQPAALPGGLPGLRPMPPKIG